MSPVLRLDIARFLGMLTGLALWIVFLSWLR